LSQSDDGLAFSKARRRSGFNLTFPARGAAGLEGGSSQEKKRSGDEGDAHSAPMGNSRRAGSARRECLSS
jgi:hypothetical protein